MLANWKLSDLSDHSPQHTDNLKSWPIPKPHPVITYQRILFYNHFHFKIMTFKIWKISMGPIFWDRLWIKKNKFAVKKFIFWIGIDKL